MLSPESLDAQITECEKPVSLGNEDKSTLDFLRRLKEDLKDASGSTWLGFNELADHLPRENEDPVLIILKGQLLVEKLVRTFVESRLPNSEAMRKQQFTAAQYIAIAEAMCLKNDEPEWLWAQVRELNTIRNKLAHNLEPQNIDLRISSFVSTVSNKSNLKSKEIRNVVGRLYGMLMGLCDISESDEHKAY